MRLEKKLNLWEAHNLITANQKNDILNFEKKPKNSWFFSAMIILGAFIVALGIISLIATNWDNISPIIKIISDLIIMGSIALASYSCHKKKHPIAFEALLFTLFMLTGASIGLIGQIFQITAGNSALLFWCFASFPLLMITQRKPLPFIWIALLIIGICCYCDEWIIKILEIIIDFWRFNEFPEIGLLILLIIGMSIVWLFTWIDRRLKNSYSVYNVAATYGYIIAYLSLVEFVLYYTFEYNLRNTVMVDLIAAIFLIISAYIYDKKKYLGKFNLNITLLYLLFLLIYFKLIGSLIFTGIGLILSGILLIGSLYLLKYTIRKIKKQSKENRHV